MHKFLSILQALIQTALLLSVPFMLIYGDKVKDFLMDRGPVTIFIRQLLGLE